MEKATVESYELGNLLFGHSRGNYQVDRKYQERFCEVLEKAGYDSYGCSESGDNLYPNFTVRPYWWGDDDAEEATLPNFECKELGLEIAWYKYPLRDSYSNIPFTDEVMESLERIVGIDTWDDVE